MFLSFPGVTEKKVTLLWGYSVSLAEIQTGNLSRKGYKRNVLGQFTV